MAGPWTPRWVSPAVLVFVVLGVSGWTLFFDLLVNGRPSRDILFAVVSAIIVVVLGYLVWSGME